MQYRLLSGNVINANKLYRFIIVNKEIGNYKNYISGGQRYVKTSQLRETSISIPVICFSINKCTLLKKKKKKENRSRKENIYCATLIKLDIIYTR